MEMTEIDGSEGEGGGQILRTSLSLSACGGKPIHIRNIRSGRKKPGLMRQHLSCVRAAAAVCNAKVKGASIGSKAVEFIPGDVKAGEYHFSIGSAGSSSLVFQTVLPALLLTEKPSKLIFEGGTHNPLAPNYDFLCDAFLPMLVRMGLRYETKIKQYGFFPVGGGHWSIEITPAKSYRQLQIEDCGELIDVKARCMGTGIPSHVMLREKKLLQERAGWPEHAISAESVRALGSGNVVVIAAHYANTCEVVDSIGALGIPAERVAQKALERMRKYQRTGAPIGEHLADQLLLPLAVAAGGNFVTGKLSDHTRTNIAVIEKISDVTIKVEATESKHRWRIHVDK